ncbi:MAG: hypothetical protein D6761_13015 [Candidatus Dadabacteria bacterium]|nr:MAG: hypothetical protein D6761_13015 [Candidatus Dadabacteria bacterium]
MRDPVEALGKTTRSEYDWIILDVADLGEAAAALIVVLREFDAGVRILALNNRMTGKAWAHPGVVVADKRNVAPVCDRLLRCDARRPGRTGSRPE